MKLVTIRSGGLHRANGISMPWCVRCDTPVESVTVEREILPAHEYCGHPVDLVDTGWRTLSVRCHGETWQRRVRV